MDIFEQAFLAAVEIFAIPQIRHRHLPRNAVGSECVVMPEGREQRK